MSNTPGAASALLFPERTRTRASRVLVVVLDRTCARILAVTATAVAEIADVASPATRGGRFHSDRHGAPGSGEHAFHQRLEEESRRHFLAIAEVLNGELIGHPDDSLLLAGPGPYATVFERHLPVHLKARVIGLEQLNPQDATPAVVARVARDAARTHRRRAEQTVWAAVAEGLGPGLATNGVRETLRALARGQVRTLLIHPRTRIAGFRCLRTGRLTVSRVDCHREGGARVVADLVRAAAREAVRQGAELVLVEDPTVAREMDGLAALLRFP